MSNFTLSMPSIWAERMKIIKSLHDIPEGLDGLIGIACAEAIVHSWLLWENLDYHALKVQIDKAYEGVRKE